MRGNAFACLLLLAVITVAVWFGCTDNPVRESRESPVPIEGDDGAGLYDWAIAPIEGITTVWHPAPKQISVPVGTKIRFKCTDPADADISWSNATLVKRTDGGSIAEVVVDKPGTFEIAVEAPESDTGGGTKGKPGGLTTTIRHSCVITGVNVAVKNIDVTASVSASPLELTESSSNEETMLAFFGGGARFQEVSRLQEIDTDRYVSAVGRMLSLKARADDERLTPLVELRVPGARPQLVGPVDVMFPASGTHVISVGPTANPRRVVIETYSVKITSHSTGQALVAENQLTTFRASTSPPGYERFITWVSSTKYGVATPVLGRGATFQATFSKTWGPHPDIPNRDFQWLGVRADNALYNQDLKVLPNCNCYFSNECAGDAICDWGPDGHQVEENCSWRRPKPEGVIGAGCTEDHPDQWTRQVCDGICAIAALGSYVGHEEPTLTRVAVALWSEAITSAAVTGGGHLDPDLVSQIQSLPFEWPHAVQAIGRQVGSIMVTVRGQSFFTHPDHEHDMEEHPVADLSNDPCRVQAGNLAIEALLAEMTEPGTGAGIVARIPEFCPTIEGMFVPVCADAGALDCVYRRIAAIAVYLTRPINR